MNAIGLDTKKAEKLAAQLNKLLANYSVFYQNMRAYHWNVKGDNFFELHEKFEELYNDLFAKIDDIAERILTLGYTPEHAYTEYFKQSEIKETSKSSNGKKMVKEILDAFQVTLKLQREILEEAGNADDEGTNSLMSDYITEQEKLVWMYSAYLG